jgi:hypothetical protein
MINHFWSYGLPLESPRSRCERAPITQKKPKPFDKALSALEAVVSADESSSTSELATRLALPITTVHPLVLQPIDRGLLRRQWARVRASLDIAASALCGRDPIRSQSDHPPEPCA